MNHRKIQKVLIANRGEIAVRIMRSCQEMGIKTVAVYSDVDRTMPHVLMADEAYRIGPAPSRESYLVIDTIIGVAKASGADAIHPGYGFLSERAEFAERVSNEGLIFIGPCAESIRAMGDKTEARKLVSKAGVPIVPGTPDAIDSERDAESFCEQAGLPVLIKAAAGGGGKGMRIVHRMDELLSAFRGAQSEAQSAFGDSRVYVEKYLENPRHIEFQILADRYGNTIHLGERECSIQRRHQKLIEETPSVIVDDTMRRRMGETAVNAAKACGYQNAGTIEFLVDEDRNYYFLEMNTRLQVEHPITELRTGIDIVAAQLCIARGEKLPWTQKDIVFSGHAIECRICAEDPHNDYLPSTGTISHLKPAMGIGVREDRGIEQGGEVSVYYDPMLSKLVCWGNTRAEAIDRMKRVLREYQLLGVKTNIPLHLFVLEHPKFLVGEFDTHFLPNNFTPEKLPQASEMERIAAAVVCAVKHNAMQANGQLSRNSVDVLSGASNGQKLGKWKSQRLENMR
jgi:acetyl-CoA carboxylase biotin carboxylase subunit